LFLIFTTEFVWEPPDKSANPRNIAVASAYIDVLAGFYVQWLVQKCVLLCASIDTVINAEDIKRKQRCSLLAPRVREGHIFSAKFYYQGVVCPVFLAAELFEYRSSATVRDN
jgi:hypothetical protein